MKFYINLEDNKIDTNVKNEIIDNFLTFFVDEGDLDINFNDNYYQQIKLVFKDNINSTITQSFRKSIELNMLYELSRGVNLNEFVIVDEDDLDINYVKVVKQAQDSFYEISNVLLSDSDIKYNVTIDLDEINAKALHNVAAIARNKNVKDFYVKINSNAKASYGELNNFGVVKDNATLNFNGIGYIKNGASQSQAHQESKIITFDPGVSAQANPYLIIDESDVEASHAAAVGAMDEEQLYYIQSRGIDYENASKLITFGYLKPIINKINNEELKTKLENLIEKKVNI